MVEGLPPTGALARAATGSPWGTTEYQLATALDRLGRMEVDFRNANRAEGASLQDYPDPQWRPGDPSPKQKAKAERRSARKSRTEYQGIVAIATPQHAEMG